MPDEKKINIRYDIQRSRWLLTINNPLDYGCDHKHIREIISTRLTTCTYVAMVDEKGSTFHTHLFICCSSRVRFSTLKKCFPEAHIEEARGTVAENISYLKKDGKWKDDEKKQEQVIPGTFEEWGVRPKGKGRNPTMTELYQMIKDGMTNAEILEENQDYILQIDKLDKVRAAILTDQFKNTRRLDLKVIYVYGVTGSFKTRHVLDRYGDANVAKINDYTHPFDNYSCQPVLCLDEFRSSLPISNMLQYCDVYPVELPARYVNKIACYNYVFILSNWRLEDQYREVQEKHPETWRAFLRRISYILEYRRDDVLGWTCSNYFYSSLRTLTSTIFPKEDIVETDWMSILDSKAQKKSVCSDTATDAEVHKMLHTSPIKIGDTKTIEYDINGKKFPSLASAAKAFSEMK